MKNFAKTKFGITLSLIFLGHLSINVLACSEFPKNETNINVTEKNWRDFRNNFPFHSQVVAYDKQNSILIITEPPNHVTLEKLKEVAPELGPIEIKQQIIGCDGWVKDLVIQVPQLDNMKRRDLFDRINKYLFHTTYKAEVVDLPVKKSPTNNDNTPLDVKVTFSDLKDWLLDKNESFESVLTGEQIQFKNLISQKKNGVYTSNAPD